MTKKNKEGIIDKAAQQVLCEALGYDEGRFYYSFLEGKEKEVQEEFSYSKKYRMLQNLFRLGAVGKHRGRTESFTYKIMPPYFLKRETDKEIKEHLEKKYADTQADRLLEQKSCLLLCNESILISFLLEEFMEKKAKIESGNKELIAELGRKFGKKVDINEEAEKTITKGNIDNKIFFEFNKISTSDRGECIGYICQQ